MIVSLTLLNLLDWGSVGEVEAPSPSVHNIIKKGVGGGVGRGGGVGGGGGHHTFLSLLFKSI